jgi:hypothetical protein
MNRHGEGFSGKDPQVLIVRSDTSNTPIEWTGNHQLSASPPETPCLPFKDIVKHISKRRFLPPTDMWLNVRLGALRF